MRRTPGTVAAALALAVTAALAGCTASGTSAGSSGGSAVGAGSAAGSAANAGGSAPAKGSADAALAAAADRQVVTTASAQVAARDTTAAADRITALVEQAGGRTEQRSQDEPGGAGSASAGRGRAHLVVRVPAASLTDALQALRAVGAVTRVSVHTDDVTASAVDLDARISALQTSTARLQDLLGRATTTADLVAAESALTDRQAQLESLQSQRRLLSGQVSLATLTLTVVPTGAPAGAGPRGFTGGLSGGWHALAVAGAGALVVVGAVLPWALALGVLAAVCAAAVRGVRTVRRRLVRQPGR